MTADANPAHSAEALLRRNPFDSVTGPLISPLSFATAPSSSQNDSARIPRCTGLAARIVTESAPRSWALVTLQAAEDRSPRLLRLGDETADLRVEAVGFDRSANSPAVWVSHGGHRCKALLFEAASDAPIERPAPSSTPNSLVAALVSKIRRLSTTEFHIDRAAWDTALEQQESLFRAVRVVPESRAGKNVGLRVFGIRPGTLLGELGLQNGDLILNINGFEIGTPERALNAFATLRSAPQLRVQLERRAGALSISYDFE